MLNNKFGFKEHEFECLLSLPRLRDEIFFPKYRRLGYFAEESCVSIVNSEMQLLKLELFLKSVLVERRISLGFVFKKGESLSNGVITDSIYNLSREHNWDTRIDMDILLYRKTLEKPNLNYRRLNNYTGNFEQQAFSCLKRIEENYDVFAQDILSGKRWDSDAHDNSYI